MRYGVSSLLIAVCVAFVGGSCGGGPGWGNSTGFSPDLPEVIELRDPVADVQDLAVPQNLDPELFGQLRAELLKQLAASGSAAAVPHPPQGSVNRISDLAFAGGLHIAWGYSNAGDYDLNGEVNAADLLPVAEYFGVTDASTDWIEAVRADGNGDGEVGMADILPVAVNYLSTVNGYQVCGSEDPADYPAVPGDPDGPGTVSLGEFTLAEAGIDPFGQLVFSGELDSALDSALYWVRPIYNDQHGDGSFPATGIGPGLEFDFERLGLDQLEQPWSNHWQTVRPERSDESLVLRILVNDSVAEHRMQFSVSFDREQYSAEDISLSDEAAGGEIENYFRSFDTNSSPLHVAAVNLTEPLAHSGEFARIKFNFEPSPPLAEPVRRVPWRLVNHAYDPHMLSYSYYNPEGFRLHNITAGPAEPIQFTIYSTFLLPDGNDDGKIDEMDIFEIAAQGNYGAQVNDTEFGPAATDYDGNGEVNAADVSGVTVSYQEAVDTIEIAIWDNGWYPGDQPSIEFSYAEGIRPNRLATFPFSASSWLDVFRTWDGEITSAMMRVRDFNNDGEVLVSARLKTGQQVGHYFEGIPISYTE